MRTSFDSIQPQRPKAKNNSLGFLNQIETSEPKNFERPQAQSFVFFKVFILTLIIVMIVGAMYLSEKIFAPNGNATFIGLNILKPLQQLAGLIGMTAKEKIVGEKDDRINLIIGGIGGLGHDGPYLTDTLMLISLKPSTQEISLVSIPRDLVVTGSDGRWTKINELYSQGKTTQADPTGKYLLEAVSKNFSLTTPYYAILDFSGFEKLIDDLGGIDVNVSKSFTDYTYPTNNYKTTVISFKAGPQHLNGKKALQFARSRHSPDNNEGSDFARAQRQQLILKALKEKIMSWDTLLSPTKLSSLYNAFSNHVDTNLNTDQLWHLYSLFKNFDVSNLHSFVLDDGPDNFLVGGTANGGAYILQPKGGSWQPLTLLIKNIFLQKELKAEASQIVVLNGTPIEGLAFTVTQSLRKLGFTVTNFTNAPTKDFSKTIIYDFTNGAKKKSADLLTTFIGGLQSPYLPDSLQSLKKVYPQMDILVILGADQNQKAASQPLIPWQIASSTATSSATLNTTSTTEFNQTNPETPTTLEIQ